MLGYNDVKFRDNKLFRGEEDTGFSVTPMVGRSLYGVCWPDGVLSKDGYNLVWAKQNCKKVYLEGQNTGLGGVTDAFKSVGGREVALEEINA